MYVDARDQLLGNWTKKQSECLGAAAGRPGKATSDSRLLPRVVFGWLCTYLTVSPWTLLHPIFDFHLAAFSNTQSCSSVLELSFREILSSYSDYAFIFTDGSADNDSVACAFYSLQSTQSSKLNSFLSVFSAEKFAIYNTLQYVNSTLVKKTVFFSDSLSALETLPLEPINDTKHWLIWCLLKKWHSAWDIAPYKLRRVKSIVKVWKSFTYYD